MNNGISLEQARALVALRQHGRFQSAAHALGRSHSAVIAAIRALETSLGLSLLDRSGYQHRFTPAGLRVVEKCQALLAAAQELATTARELRDGWEPHLRIVCDGIVDTTPLLQAIGELASQQIPTELEVRAEFLGGVEATFFEWEADMMVSVLPPSREKLVGTKLAPLTASLLAHRDHPMCRPGADRRAYVMYAVRGADPRLQLPHAGEGPIVRLNDFAAKKSAVLAGLGYGWLPDYLTTVERKRGLLTPVVMQGPTTHTFRPCLYRRPHAPGRAWKYVAAALKRAAVTATQGRCSAA